MSAWLVILGKGKRHELTPSLSSGGMKFSKGMKRYLSLLQLIVYAYGLKNNYKEL